MIKIEKTIKDLCPNGVVFKKLKSLVNFTNGKGHEKVVEENGKYILITSKAISTDMQQVRRTNKILTPLNKDDITMVMSDLPNGRALAKCFIIDAEETYTLNQRVCGLKVINTNEILPKYLYYVLNRNTQLLKYDNGVDQTNLKKDDILNINIAVPPIDAQREIIKILDNFTLLLKTLSEELNARIMQYEFYKNCLLEPKKNYKKISMKDICSIITKQTGFDYSATIKPSLVQTNSNETLSFIQNKDFNGRSFNYNTDYYIPKSVASKFPKITLDQPSILFSISGKIGNVGLFMNKEKAFIGGAICICKLEEDIELLPEYIMYYAQSKYGQKYLFKNIKAASHLNITVEAIRELEIYYPSIEEQKRIVNILNSFDTLCNDIYDGLPAEIEKRQKQYEYYRDKLLNFKEAEVNE